MQKDVKMHFILKKHSDKKSMLEIQLEFKSDYL